VVLSGGLNPENVSAAVQQVAPVAVDTASGVESFPGVKDAELMRRFVLAARSGRRDKRPSC
jgi:phosphoribosylanthranilate isomerase